MKKLISALLAVGLLLNLCACGDKNKEDSGNNETPANVENTEDIATDAPSGEAPTGEIADFLVNNEWSATDNTGVVMFNSDGSFGYFSSTKNDDGSISTMLAKSGNWAVTENDELELTFDDGETEICVPENSFYVGGLAATFTNGKISTEVLESWYGKYVGELGEIEVSESIFDTSISVSIFLNDDVGSMYSTTLELDYTGRIASDDNIELILDGENLRIEELYSEFANYVGDYVKEQTEE